MVNKPKAVISMVLIALVLLTGCSAKAPSSSTASSESAADAGEANANSNANVAETPSEGAVTVTIWDNFTDEAPSKALDELITSFEEANPSISIKRTTLKNEDLRNTIKPALTSGKGPDIFNYDAGPGYLGVLAKSGLAMDLTQYVDTMGWSERFPAWVNERVTFDNKVYGIGNEIELIGVYYNKKIFEELGVEVPKTYEQFLEICKKAKEKGLVAVSFDDKDQWPAFHLESVFYTATAGKDKIREVLDKQASFDQPVFAEALDTFGQLIKDGYISPNPLSVSFDDGNKEFYAGKAAMRITGSWMVSEMVENMKDNVGFFIMPSVNPELPLSAPGGIGGAMVVSAKTKQPEATVKFLNFLFTRENAVHWYQNSKIPPLDIDVESLDASPLFKEVVKMVNTPAGLSYNIDVLMPQKVNNVTQNIMQELIAGKKTGSDVVKEKQKAFQEEIAAGNY
ncbi:extracellular solute-binding protein [Paenibacillus sepulcri]|uniref:extracellular solute-binding protein n=1 Tax=Paenibacillus sepulcri TaxID=359917 RepID=UPI001AE53525